MSYVSSHFHIVYSPKERAGGAARRCLSIVAREDVIYSKLKINSLSS